MAYVEKKKKKKKKMVWCFLTTVPRTCKFHSDPLYMHIARKFKLWEKRKNTKISTQNQDHII